MKFKYHEFKPAGILSNYIECYWTYKSLDKKNKHTILPKGTFDLIAEYKGGNLSKLILTGISTYSFPIEIPEHTTVLGIRFKLPASEYLFKKEIKHLLNKIKIVDPELWKIKNYNFHDFDLTVTKISDNIKQYMTSSGYREIDNKKLLLFMTVYQTKSYSVDAICEQSSWKSRQINRYFNKQFGISLKEYLNILRCSSAFRGISKGILTPQHGFYDQSHFIKEVKKYSGTTPSKLYKNRAIYLNCLN